MFFKVEFELYCSECGGKLELERGRQPTNIPYFEVVPCQTCLDAAHDDGYSEGYDEGEADWYRED